MEWLNQCAFDAGSICKENGTSKELMQAVLSDKHLFKVAEQLTTLMAV